MKPGQEFFYLWESEFQNGITQLLSILYMDMYRGHTEAFLDRT